MVAILMEKSLEMVVAMLGVLKSGSAYVPLDPKWPVERRKFILEQAECQMLITCPLSFEKDLPAQLGFAGEVLWFENCREFADTEAPGVAVEVPGDALAYVIYTSGSTGQPKGVMMRHGGVAGCVARCAEQLVSQGSR